VSRSRPFGSLVLSCEHASNRTPKELRSVFAGARELLATHRGYDIGALEVARALANALNAPLVEARCSRLVVDANRSAESRSVFSEFTRDLPERQRNELLRRHHAPHRTKVLAQVRRSLPAVHISVHSFTPIWKSRTRRADVGLLFDPQRPRERELCEQLRRQLRALDPSLRVLFNEPYRGWTDGLTTALRTRFSDPRYIGVELELNQRLSSAPRPRTALANALSAALRAVLAQRGSARPRP